MLRKNAVYAKANAMNKHLPLDEVPEAVMQRNKESCEIDKVVILSPKIGGIVDQEEIEVGDGMLSVLLQDVSGSL